jgi:hypothetical protein
MEIFTNIITDYDIMSTPLFNLFLSQIAKHLNAV